MIEKNIPNRGPKRRDEACFQTQHAILIPAGTILRQESGKAGTFTCPVAHGIFSVDLANAEAHRDTFKKVIAG